MYQMLTRDHPDRRQTLVCPRAQARRQNREQMMGPSIAPGPHHCKSFFHLQRDSGRQTLSLMPPGRGLPGIIPAEIPGKLSRLSVSGTGPLADIPEYL